MVQFQTYRISFSRIFCALLIALSCLSSDLQAKSNKLETAILAGGCFWGMEEVFRKIPGVISTEVGYTGGSASSPYYSQVSSGTTGHAESIRILFDPKKTTYEDLLKTFFRMHDPTSENRQGNDIGTQYRSEIFYVDDSQKKIATEVIEKVNRAAKWPKPVVTRISKAGTFYPAEEYHQKYLVKSPNGYNDHYLRNFTFDDKKTK